MKGESSGLTRWRDWATGNTLLHVAAQRDNAALAKRVLHIASADYIDELVDVKNRREHTALHECVASNAMAVLDLLLERSPAAARKHSRSVRMLAEQLGRTSIRDYMTLVEGRLAQFEQLDGVTSTILHLEARHRSQLAAVAHTTSELAALKYY
jgi:ankyrin repeat protein